MLLTVNLGSGFIPSKKPATRAPRVVTTAAVLGEEATSRLLVPPIAGPAGIKMPTAATLSKTTAQTEVCILIDEEYTRIVECVCRRFP
jgi:hypothetical protein